MLQCMFQLYITFIALHLFLSLSWNQCLTQDVYIIYDDIM
jgi:hypothetical protein